jgi:hypothetical protein
MSNRDKDPAYFAFMGTVVLLMVSVVCTPLLMGMGFGPRNGEDRGLFGPENTQILGVSTVRAALSEDAGAVRPSFEDLRVPKPVVKGIHITSWVAGGKTRIAELVAMIDETELNTAVIDLKESDGRIAYEADVPMAREIGSVERRIPHLDDLLRTLKEHQIYKIARIVVFKDTYLAEHRPDLALRSRSTGGIWRDFKGAAFADPYQKGVWDYNIGLAEDAARQGFDEIQFDYIRFPSDGVLSDIRYPEGHNEQAAIGVIEDFVKDARGRLAPYHVTLSVDVFGLTTVRDDVGIGQNFKDLSRLADVISPMVYPSHYYKGSYGFSNPNAAPYEIIHRSLKDAIRRSSDETHTEDEVRRKIRPWLQDFTLGAPRYGAKEVRSQILAANDRGIEEWLLWNPMVHYTRAALQPTGSQVTAVAPKGKDDGGDGILTGRTEETSPCPPNCL